MRRSLARRIAVRLALVLALGVGIALLWPNSPALYLVRQGMVQASLLWGRVPVASMLDAPELTEKQRERLRLSQEIIAFGARQGLNVEGRYQRVNPTWDYKIWNVSAAGALSFEAREWWFPIVGTVPYLGYFDRDQALEQVRLLQAQGWDVKMRRAGAYSTLGWFDDPLTLSMLGGSERGLANTLLHELTHATLWIPGSVTFNESLASFVGDTLEMRWLVEKYGEDGEPVRDAIEADEDSARWRRFMHGVYEDLDAVYRDPNLSYAEKLRIKQQTFASLPIRVARLDLHRRRHYVKYAAEESWNNAQLGNFRRYNDDQDGFAAILEAADGDIPKFLARVERIVSDADDPKKAIKRAAKKLAARKDTEPSDAPDVPEMGVQDP
jgi:predicted aminopeptidase